MTGRRAPDDKASPELSAVILEGRRAAVAATEPGGNIVSANRASRELLVISLRGADEDARRDQAATGSRSPNPWPRSNARQIASGASDGSRTRKPLRAANFKSAVSASSTTLARAQTYASRMGT
jgi:hypothetical protein